MEGGAGNDLYIIRRGEGQDTINNIGGGNDTLRFVDLDPIDLWWQASGNHLIIGQAGASDKVTVNNWFANGDYKIDRIEANGYALLETRWPCSSRP